MNYLIQILNNQTKNIQFPIYETYCLKIQFLTNPNESIKTYAILESELEFTDNDWYECIFFDFKCLERLKTNCLKNIKPYQKFESDFSNFINSLIECNLDIFIDDSGLNDVYYMILNKDTNYSDLLYKIGNTNFLKSGLNKISKNIFSFLD